MIPFKEIVTCAHDVILVTKAEPLDSTGPEIIFANKAFELLTGYSQEEVIGQTPRVLQGEKTDRETLDRVKIALLAKEAIRFEIINYTKDQRAYWLDCSIIPLVSSDGKVEHFAAIERDLTDYKKMQKELTMLAMHDPLTGSFNRRAFFEYANKKFNLYQRNKVPFAVALIDVDNFKQINDQYGHQIGDAVIQKLVYCLNHQVRRSDIIGRLGGDEFIICFNEVKPEALHILCEALISSISSKVVVDHRAIDLSVSIGCSLVGDADSSLDSIIARADYALYQVKRSVKGRYKIKEN